MSPPPLLLSSREPPGTVVFIYGSAIGQWPFFGQTESLCIEATGYPVPGTACCLWGFLDEKLYWVLGRRIELRLEPAWFSTPRAALDSEAEVKITKITKFTKKKLKFQMALASRRLRI